MLHELVAKTVTDARQIPGFNRLSEMDQTDIVGDMVLKQLEKIAPQLGAKLLEIAEPAARKAAESIEPVLEQKLQKYIPIFALISGAILGGAVLLGVFVSRRR